MSSQIVDLTNVKSRGGGDPFLTGEVAFETITGIQSSGAQACAKHYINKYAKNIILLGPSLLILRKSSEQEHFRESSSSVVDDR